MKPELRQQGEKIARIFLSATAKDCGEYRIGVKKAVSDRVRDATVHLQEYWVGPWRDVVNCCLKELEFCHAYFGVFGFRYGWVPDGNDRSITELEFEAACSKWLRSQVNDPPIFVFLPDERSSAARELFDLAERFLEEEFRGDDVRKQRSRECQENFRNRVCSGRTVNRFGDLHDLREQAITSVLTYNMALLEKTSQVLPPPVSATGRLARIPDEELGPLGREPQLKALEEALGTFRTSPNAPALCALVHGPENYGQRQLSAFLRQWELWELESAEPFSIRTQDADDLQALIGAMRECVGDIGGGEPSIESLASAIMNRRETDNVVFILEDIGSRSDRLGNFHRALWAPLEHALRDRWADTRNRTRRCMIVAIDHAVLDGSGQDWVDDAAVPADFSRGLALPVLKALSQAEVEVWLKTLAGRGWRNLKSQAQRRAIAARVTQTRTGQPDGTPLNVYSRLEDENFWNTR